MRENAFANFSKYFKGRHFTVENFRKEKTFEVISLFKNLEST